jgi:hypothetical protein
MTDEKLEYSLVFSGYFLLLLLFLFLTKWISIPQAKITSPIIKIVNPFTVHWGLLYINEDCGPIVELLCATNIIPAIISTKATTSSSKRRINLIIYK